MGCPGVHGGPIGRVLQNFLWKPLHVQRKHEGDIAAGEGSKLGFCHPVVAGDNNHYAPQMRESVLPAVIDRPRTQAA